MFRTLSIALVSLAVVSACKKDEAPADPSVVAKVTDPASKLDPLGKAAGDTAAKAATDLANQAIDPGADPKSAALAAQALTKLSEFKDRVCACKDKACADKVQEDIEAWGKNLENTPMKDFKPDEATTKKLDEMEHAMSLCADKASGVAPKVVGENTEMENKALALMDKMTDMFLAGATNCDQLAVTVTKFVAENKAFMDELNAYMKKQTDAQKQAFEERNQARLEGSAKIGPVMQTCGMNPKFQAAIESMPK